MIATQVLCELLPMLSFSSQAKNIESWLLVLKDTIQSCTYSFVRVMTIWFWVQNIITNFFVQHLSCKEHIVSQRSRLKIECSNVQSESYASYCTFYHILAPVGVSPNYSSLDLIGFMLSKKLIVTQLSVNNYKCNFCLSAFM